MNSKLCALVVALPFLAACAGGTGQTPKDRYGLAQQPQVYLVHQTAKKTFLIESTGYRFVGGPVAAIMQTNESARLQQRLDLRDPVNYLKDRLEAELRRELGLTNLRVQAEASDLPVLPESLGDEARAANAATFKQKHPTGIIIEVATSHWGIDNYKMKYSASVWVTDLTNSKRLAGLSCGGIVFDQVDDKKMPPRGAFDQYGKYDAQQGDAYVTAMEEAIFGNSGAVLKASLRKAAEMCADRFVPRFMHQGKFKRE